MIDRIIADLHTHTNVSQHAYSTAYENIMEAVRKGLVAVAITNHGPSMPDGASEGHFRNLRVMPKDMRGVRVLRGVEANIMDYDGHIDMTEDTIKNRLDVCIASFHDDVCQPGTIEEHTMAYMALAENKRVDIIGHSGTEVFKYDYEKVIRKFADQEKIVEINEATFKVRPSSIQNCMTIARLCKKYGVHVMIDTDAHFCSLIGYCPKSIKMLNEIDFPKELVINGTRENLEKWMQKRGIYL